MPVLVRQPQQDAEKNLAGETAYPTKACGFACHPLRSDFFQHHAWRESIFRKFIDACTGWPGEVAWLR
jgi:hypothetical protein